MNKGTNGFPHNHYIDTCKILGINHNRYSNIKEDNNGNFILNMVEFEKYLINLL
jgi:hypothetical protein